MTSANPDAAGESVATDPSTASVDDCLVSPTAAPIETPAETADETPTETVAEWTEESADEPAEESADEPIEQAAEEIVDGPAPELAPEPALELPADPDPVLVAAVELARDAAIELAGSDAVGEHQEAQVEDGSSVTHYFAANQPGYRGWRWAVTVARGGADTEVTISETTLLPGTDALVAPTWVPWQERVRPGDLGVGDLLPTDPDDPRLVPGYLGSDDPQVRDVVHEVGLGRVRVMSRLGRDEAGERWHEGTHGPRTDMARAAPGTCVTCGFYLQLSGSLAAAFGVCANEFAPADGAVVHAEYGCGAHSDVEADQSSVAPVAELVYDDGVDLESR